MTRAISRTAVFTFVTVLAVVLAGGCGGGGEPGVSDPVNGQAGSVVLHIQWPERAEIDPQLIPELSDFIEVEITDLSTGAVRVSDLLERPDEAPWTTEATYENVLISSNARLTATAWPVDPNEDPAAVAQASGSMQIVIPAGGVAYPRDGSPGDPISLVMGSRVLSVVITANTDAQSNGEPFQVEVSETLQLAATAHDAWGNMVLVPGFTWSSTDSSVAVDQEGLVTGEGVGESEITATEVESGVSGSVTVEVMGDRLELEPSSAVVYRGEQQQFRALLVTAGSEEPQDVTAEADWSVSHWLGSTITDDGLLITGDVCDGGWITAEYQGLEATATVLILEPSRVEITPEDDMTLAPGDTVEFTATVWFCDLNVYDDVTSRAVWEFSGPAEVGVIDENGRFTVPESPHVSAGEGVVSATYWGITAYSGTITVAASGDVPITISDTEGGRE